MPDKERRKELKQLEKEMGELQKLYSSLELSPCKSDREIKEKDQALKELRGEILELEKKRDHLLYTRWKAS